MVSLFRNVRKSGAEPGLGNDREEGSAGLIVVAILILAAMAWGGIYVTSEPSVEEPESPPKYNESLR